MPDDRWRVWQGQTPMADRNGRRGSIIQGARDDGFTLPVAPGGETVGGREKLKVGGTGEGIPNIIQRPDVEFSLQTLGVGIQGRVETTTGMGQLAGDEIERALHHTKERRVAGELPGVQIGADEQGVVVEHLLEMRDTPDVIGAVA